MIYVSFYRNLSAHEYNMPSEFKTWNLNPLWILKWINYEIVNDLFYIRKIWTFVMKLPKSMKLLLLTIDEFLLFFFWPPSLLLVQSASEWESGLTIGVRRLFLSFCVLALPVRATHGPWVLVGTRCVHWTPASALKIVTKVHVPLIFVGVVFQACHLQKVAVHLAKRFGIWVLLICDLYLFGDAQNSRCRYIFEFKNDWRFFFVQLINGICDESVGACGVLWEVL